MRSLQALLAYLLLAIGLSVSPGLLLNDAGQVALDSWLALGGIGFALALCLAAVWHRGQPSPALVNGMAFRVAMILLAISHVAGLVLTRPSYYRSYHDQDPWLVAFRAGAAVLALVALSYFWHRWRWPAVRSTLALSIYALLGVSVLLAASRKPNIDVWLLQQHACGYLLQGTNPYDARYPNPYGDRALEFLGPELLEDDQIRSFPYPPTSLLLTIPGYLLGDIRWSYLAALLGTAALMLATGRQLGLPAGHPVELAALLFLCQPYGLLVLETGWTEPFQALTLTAAFWAAASERTSATSLLLAVTASLKQYAPLAIVSAWPSARFRWRPFVVGALAMLTVTVPFILWNPTAFWRGLLGFHLHSPFRADSLSIPAVLAVSTEYSLSPLAGFMAAGLVVVLLVVRQVRCPSAAVLGITATLLTFFVFNKAAHVNYYWLTRSLLLLALVLAVAEEHKGGQFPTEDMN